MICPWCDGPMTPRTTGGSQKRFCSTRCRSAFHTAARRFVDAGIRSGALTVDQVRNAPQSAYTLQPAGLGEITAQ